MGADEAIGVRVRALRPGFRRAGRAWPAEWTEVPADGIDGDTFAALVAEPMLVVEMVLAIEGPTGDAAGDGQKAPDPFDVAIAAAMDEAATLIIRGLPVEAFGSGGPKLDPIRDGLIAAGASKEDALAFKGADRDRVFAALTAEGWAPPTAAPAPAS